MRNKIILLVLALSFFLGITLVCFKSLATSKPIVRSIDNKGIYVGNGKSGLELAPDEASQFNRTVNALNEGWDNIGIGNSYFQAEQYEEAARAYKKAYEIDSGNRIFSGKKLIGAYEKLFRFDEALAVVEDILKTQPLGDVGIKRFEAIRARLLAAKENSKEPPR